MTFKEFRESEIDYEMKYKELLRSSARKGDGFEMTAYRCYMQYKCFCILRDIRESKVAHKPMHYKVFDAEVKTYSNGYARFYVITDDVWGGKRSSIGMYPIKSGIGHSRFPVRLNDDNTIDWEEMDSRQEDIVNPEELEELFIKQTMLNEHFKQDVRDLVTRYSEEYNKMPQLTEMVWIQMR